MTPDELSAYLHQHIPLSAAMDVRATEASDSGVRLQAPLDPNINHRETAFGGSLSALAILTAWSYLHRRLSSEGHSARVVIQSSRVDFVAPATGSFDAWCPAPPDDDWQRFTTTLARRSRARLTLTATLTCGDTVVASFSGAFVALAG